MLRDAVLDALATINCAQEFQRCQQSLNRIIEVAVHVSPHSKKFATELGQHALVVVSTAQDHARLARRKASRITRAMAFSNASRVPWRLYQR